DRAVVLAVRDKAPFSLTAEVERITVLQGDQVKVPVKLTRLWPDFKAPVQVTAFPQPQNLIVQPLTLTPGKDTGTALVSFKGQVQPGTFSVVLRGQTQAAGKQPKQPKQPAAGAIVQPATPVLLTIVPRQLAKVTLTPQNLTLKAGKETELVVKVARLFDYEGEFKVQLVLPPDVKGLSAMEVTIPADKSEARLVLVADEDAPPGNRTGLSVRATTVVNGTLTVQHDAKLTVNVTK